MRKDSSHRYSCKSQSTLDGALLRFMTTTINNMEQIEQRIKSLFKATAITKNPDGVLSH